MFNWEHNFLNGKNNFFWPIDLYDYEKENQMLNILHKNHLFVLVLSGAAKNSMLSKNRTSDTIPAEHCPGKYSQS